MTTRRPSLVFFATLGTLALVPALSACSSTLSKSGLTASSASASISSDSAPSGSSNSSGSSGRANTAVGTLIDVRTPEESTDNHLRGATDIDFSGPDFAEKISKLDKNGEYTLYCHSGRRSGLTLETIKTAGFTEVADAGGVEQASKTLGPDIAKD